MRLQWTNTILQITAKISKRKRGLIRQTGALILSDVIVILVLEIYLALISLPMYLIMQSKEGALGSVEYRIRRIITLSVLVALLILWAIKLLLIVIVPSVLESNSLVIIQESFVSELILEEDVFPNIHNAPLSEQVAPPTDITIAVGRTGTLVAKGKGLPGSLAVLYVGSKEREELVNMYLTDVTDFGEWEIIGDRSLSRLQPGIYSAYVTTYDAVRGIKSNSLYAGTIDVRQTFLDRLTDRFDVWVNYMAAGLVAFGIFLTVLII
ncbi:hypothetical protein COB18_00455 [Candidatus Kaiserbacteria bacterium]|nr:MAG: hypothetical protein COB18_00455 [Candidatus Kaiserbacteria bacterium]